MLFASRGVPGAMRYFALATDYDGTLATHGLVEASTVEALERFIASGRRLVLVTGRQLEDLEHVCPRLDLFERVVAENGAVLYSPTTNEIRVLDEPPPEAFVSALCERGVAPLMVGRVIVATWEPHQAAVLDAIRELGLELHVEFNKGAVMVLPAGVTKRTGLAAALDDMGLSPHNVVGVGDAENDHSFLAFCECSTSVANALASLKQRSDWVTSAPHGQGVTELIDRMIADDLQSLAPALARHRLFVGRARDCPPKRGRGDEHAQVTVEPYGTSVLIAGPSGSGKSTIAVALVERLLERCYQVCVIDPEGDYEHVTAAAAVGSAEHAPTVDEVRQLLEDPRRSVVATLVAVSIEDRAHWFAALLARVESARAHSGRPHWLVVDEAHHVLPASWGPALFTLPKRIGQLLLMTVHPESVSPAVLAEVGVVIATADGAEMSLRAFAQATGRGMPELPDVRDAAVVWRVGKRTALAVDVPLGHWHHLRHKRKYARGELGEDKSFWFRGPANALHLRAQNLALFVQIGSGVDDATLLHHLRAGDYSMWFRDAIKDDELANEAQRVEAQKDLTARESWERIRAAIVGRYSV
jgi:hydroxymethylpyrimidine pyrophosphatase-like HAD family hydrolase/energy-coupling factor transporter ATP-binding protein EcfA2